MQQFVKCCWLACLLLHFCGCGGQRVKSKIASSNATSLQRLTNCYTYYQAKHAYNGPPNESALREFIADPINKKGFDRAGIDVSDVDALFISDRDGHPFRVKYGVKGSSFGFDGAVVFESVGVDGELMVGFGGARTELMSLEESDELFESKAQVRSKRIDRPEDVE
jgi:hypothetical protein